MAVIDFHSHILPGIDDGSKNVDMSQKMLNSAVDQGIEIIVATPHFYADRMSIDGFLRNREHALDSIQEYVTKLGIRFCTGAEVAYFGGIGQAEEIEKLMIQGTNLLLLEMPFRAWGDQELNEVNRLLRRGIKVVIAHLERFYQFQKDKNVISELLDMSVIIQINAECLLQWNTRRFAFKLIKNGCAPLLGSDCHNLTSRPENLAQARKILKKKFGEKLLCEMDRYGTSLLEGKD